MKTQFHRLLAPALPLAAALVGAFVLVSPSFADQPYGYTPGQYTIPLEMLGLPPQVMGQESIGMRQARFAAGQSAGATVTVINSGSVTTITSTVTPSANSEAGTEVAVANRPGAIQIGGAIRTSLEVVAVREGASAAADGPATAAALRNAAYGADARDSVAICQMRVAASAREIDAQQARAAQFAGDQTRSSQALTEMQTSRAKLDTDFADAQTATPDSWNQIRSTLAADYQTYADAVSRAQAAANRRSS
jgi:hypothetical protein